MTSVPPPTRLNVSFAPHGGALQETLGMIARGDLVLVDSNEPVDPQQIASLIAARAAEISPAPSNARGARDAADPVTLDLIGHADSQGVLQFGGWEVSATETTSRTLRMRWDAMQLRPSAIRLLGCNTALFSGGQAAIRHLADVFEGVEIWGATCNLKASDFDAGGFSVGAEGRLAVSSALPPAEDAATEATALRQLRDFERWIPDPGPFDVFDRLRPEMLDEAMSGALGTVPQPRRRVTRFAAADAKQLFDQLDLGQIASARGLLVWPDAELLFAAESSREQPRFHRATILLGGWFVRVYPVGLPDGLIFMTRTRQPVVPPSGGVPVALPGAVS